MRYCCQSKNLDVCLVLSLLKGLYRKKIGFRIGCVNFYRDLKCLHFHRWSVQCTAAWRVSWRWQSSSESPKVIFRSGCKQGGPGWRTNHRHPARQHDTHSGEYCTAMFLMKVMFSGMYYVFGFWHVWLFIFAGAKHCPLLENTFHSFPLTWRGIWKWWQLSFDHHHNLWFSLFFCVEGGFWQVLHMA